MKIKNKILSSLAGIVLTVGLVAGCGSENEENLQSCEKKITRYQDAPGSIGGYVHWVFPDESNEKIYFKREDCEKAYQNRD